MLNPPKPLERVAHISTPDLLGLFIQGHERANKHNYIMLVQPQKVLQISMEIVSVANEEKNITNVATYYFQISRTLIELTSYNLS